MFNADSPVSTMLSALFVARREPPKTQSKQPQKRKQRPLALPQSTPRQKSMRPLAQTPQRLSKNKSMRPAKGSSGPSIVGSVLTSDAAHWRHHRGRPDAAECCRCLAIQNADDLAREAPWCKPRPSYMGCHWRLGCDICAWEKTRAHKENHNGRRGSDCRSNAFANYDVANSKEPWRKVLQHIKQHATTDGHKAAVTASRLAARSLPERLLKEPESRPLATETPSEACRPLATAAFVVDEAAAEAAAAEATAAVAADKALLKGRAPQAQDWLNAWAETTENLSFHKQARLSTKRNIRRWKNERRIRRNQLAIMAEARREVIKNHLLEAKYISLSMDDRKYKKIIRFRCDAPAEPFKRRGILGVLALDKSAVGDFEEDHALVATRKLDSFLNRFCTPLSSKRRPLATDHALKEHIRKRVRTFAADGASKERRGLLMAAQELFPNVALLLRDSAHALRIAIKDPLHFDSAFGEVWELLFNERHALVPDVMNSEKWQDLLQHMQKTVLRIPMEDRPLAVALKHLRFAKQRFDSSADPMAKVALMLLPLATLLAFIGSDERHKPAMRDRAKMILKKLDSKFCLTIAVSADWGLICQAFLRLFDQTSHDIAKTYHEIESFKKVLRALFLKGRVFYGSRDIQLAVGNALSKDDALPAIGGYFGEAGVKPMFITHGVEKALQRRAVFNCGSEQVLLWGFLEVGTIVSRGVQLRARHNQPGTKMEK